MTKLEEVGIWCGLIALILVGIFIASCALIMIMPTQQGIIETQYEVIVIDLQTLIYVNNENEIITINWSDKTRQIDIVNSNTTYIVHATNGYWVMHTLYLNVSDLEA